VNVLAQGHIQPLGVAITRDGNIAVTDCQGKRVRVRRSITLISRNRPCQISCQSVLGFSADIPDSVVRRRLSWSLYNSVSTTVLHCDDVMPR